MGASESVPVADDDEEIRTGAIMSTAAVVVRDAAVGAVDQGERERERQHETETEMSYQ